MSVEREVERDCPICGTPDALRFFASYDNDPEVGLFGWGVDLEEVRCGCPLTPEHRRDLARLVSRDLREGDADDY